MRHYPIPAQFHIQIKTNHLIFTPNELAGLYIKVTFSRGIRKVSWHERFLVIRALR